MDLQLWIGYLYGHRPRRTRIPPGSEASWARSLTNAPTVLLRLLLLRLLLLLLVQLLLILPVHVLPQRIALRILPIMTNTITVFDAIDSACYVPRSTYVLPATL